MPADVPSRRQFLKQLSVFAGSGLLANALPGASLAHPIGDETVPANDRVRIGVIGVGSRGRYHVLVLNQMPQVEITSVCDNYPPHYERAQELTGGTADAYWDYRRLLEEDDPDAVIIATPLHEHAQMTIDALSNGTHVLCEKTMGYTVDECIDMYNAHKDAGKSLLIGLQRRFNVKYLAAKKLAEEGFLGGITQIRAWWHRNSDWRRPVPDQSFPDWELDPEYPSLEHKINWRLYREYSRGLATELAAHQLHVANWFLGTLPLSVRGSGSTNYWTDGREVYDNINMVYTYPEGVHVIYDSLTSNKHYSLEEQLMGPDGTFELEAGQYYHENPPPAPGILQLLSDIEDGLFGETPLGGESWNPQRAADTSGAYFTDEYPLPNDTQLQNEAFVETIRQGSPASDLAREGLYASIATLIGHKAMRENRAVAWPDETLSQRVDAYESPAAVANQS
jgi:predicted dehydrogenase